MVAHEFPSSSWSLLKGSPAATHYRAQLLSLMDALVTASEAGAHVTATLKVVAD